jgi:aldose 1-epimerase
MRIYLAGFLAISIVFSASASALCALRGTKAVEVRPFGSADGKSVFLYTLKNHNGIEATLTNYGATLVSLKVPDRHGKFADVVLGYDDLDSYARGHSYFGATVGRYGNRIGNARFTLNGVTYHLAKNDGPNSLHGGTKGFNKVVWEGHDVTASGVPAVQFTYVSKDGEEGYPGNLTAKVTYTLTDSNELKLEYDVTTDRDTVQNLTHHSYFNLSGAGHEILGHELQLNADRFTPVDATLIPTGELASVEGTPFDFRRSTAIGARIGQANEQLQRGNGYDHNWVLNGASGSLRSVALVYEPLSGRTLEVFTTEPGMQFYSGNFLDGSEHGKRGIAYAYRTGFCLETQHFPDSPNHPQFPSTTLRAGQHYYSTTIYKFASR